MAIGTYNIKPASLGFPTWIFNPRTKMHFRQHEAVNRQIKFYKETLTNQRIYTARLATGIMMRAASLGLFLTGPAEMAIRINPEQFGWNAKPTKKKIKLKKRLFNH